MVRDSSVGRLVFLRLGFKDFYGLTLVFLRLWVRDACFRGLVFLRLGVSFFTLGDK